MFGMCVHVCITKRIVRASVMNYGVRCQCNIKGMSTCGITLNLVSCDIIYDTNYHYMVIAIHAMHRITQYDARQW